jgi:hypothetical protein
VEVQRIENPRVEAEEHPYEVIHEKLSDRFGFQSESGFADEVRHLFRVLTQAENRDRILAMRDTLFPKTKWSGEHGKLAVLETWKPAA